MSRPYTGRWDPVPFSPICIAPRQFSIEHFGWLSDAPCASVHASVHLCVRNGMFGPESIRRIFLIFCMKLTYNDTTKHIFQFFKISNMAAIIAININNFQLKYRKVWAGRNLLGRSFSSST